VRGNHVTVSIGIANVPHSRIDDQGAFFRAADQALLRAKINGRNRVEIERRRICRARDARRTVQRAGEALG
jgi:PleD family two-component response regulator